MIDFRECFFAILFNLNRNAIGMDYHKVKEDFDKVIDTLGAFDKNELMVNIDLRVKNNYGYWEAVNSVCRGIHIKTSQYFLRRESIHRKLPFARSIETKEQLRGRIKDHAHIIIRMKDLKQFYEPQEVIDIVENICYSMKEVNSKDRSKDNPPVNVRTFPYWEDKYNTLGKRIVYICKDSTKHYSPLANGLYPN